MTTTKTTKTTYGMLLDARAAQYAILSQCVGAAQRKPVAACIDALDDAIASAFRADAGRVALAAEGFSGRNVDSGY